MTVAGRQPGAPLPKEGRAAGGDLAGGRTRPRAAAGVCAGGGGQVLDLGPEQWWHNEPGERLRMQVVGSRPVVDEDGTVAWVAVRGWRLLPDGGRRWERSLVRADAVGWES